MSAEQRLREVQDRASRSARVREQFGLSSSREHERVRDWLTGAGAIPATVGVLLVVAYLVVSVLVGLSGP